MMREHGLGALALVAILTFGGVSGGLALAATPAVEFNRQVNKDPCEVALDNIGAVDLIVTEAIQKAKDAPKSFSARRLAVVQASTGKGFLQAMRVLLPLACRGERLDALDSAIAQRIGELDAFIHGNW